jgi:hypothetical protein
VVQLQLQFFHGDPIEITTSPIIIGIIAHVVTITRKKGGVIQGGNGWPVFFANYVHFGRLGYEGASQKNQGCSERARSNHHFRHLQCLCGRNGLYLHPSTSTR